MSQQKATSLLGNRLSSVNIIRLHELVFAVALLVSMWAVLSVFSFISVQSGSVLLRSLLFQSADSEPNGMTLRSRAPYHIELVHEDATNLALLAGPSFASNLACLSREPDGSPEDLPSFLQRRLPAWAPACGKS